MRNEFIQREGGRVKEGGIYTERGKEGGRERGEGGNPCEEGGNPCERGQGSYSFLQILFPDFSLTFP